MTSGSSANTTPLGVARVFLDAMRIGEQENLNRFMGHVAKTSDSDTAIGVVDWLASRGVISITVDQRSFTKRKGMV